MNLHLAVIAHAVAPVAHAMLLVDQAGCQMTPKLTVPPNISTIPPPAKSPELNPQENVWPLMRDNWLSNRVFTSDADIVDHCCYAGNKLVEEPWRIMLSECEAGHMRHNPWDWMSVASYLRPLEGHSPNSSASFEKFAITPIVH